METEPKNPFLPVTTLSVILGVGLLLSVSFSAPAGYLIGSNTITKYWFNVGVFSTAVTFLEGVLVVVALTQKYGHKAKAIIPLVFALIAAWLSVCSYGVFDDSYREHLIGIESRNGKYLLVACKGFAEENDGQWPKTLEELGPDYLPEGFLKTVVSGDGKMPGFDYTPPSKSGTANVIVLTSKTPVYGNKYAVGYSDGSIRIESKPFSP